MTFARPELLALALLAPAAALAAAGLWRRRLRAAEAWAARGLWHRLLAGYSPVRLALSVGLLAVAVLAAGLALARPRWGETRERVAREGVDVVIVLDASLSMGAIDVQPSRLAVAKNLVRRLVQETPGNRVALIAAEGDGVVMAPLTTDVAVVDLLLDGIEPGSLPTPGTRLGDALDRVPALFPPGTERHRAAVLLSDGEDHGGGLAARIGRLTEAGVVVHAVGVGTPQGAPVPLPGAPGELRRRRDGSVVISRLHEEVLEEIARATGGVYLRATDPGRSLAPILGELDRMDRRRHDVTELDTRAERFQWPLAAAVAALLGHLALAPFAPRRGGGRAEVAG
ncbi:MAG TPA: VWA domain-containing protein [Thermoanaerobaculia bacterium]|nr:VWA domain-containing protein [Thermoanaerobaculia bacterium]